MARFYFAFVESTDNIWNNSFKRNDADVFSFDLTHEEGQFARLDVEIKNPKIGLLAPSRKQWAWLSYENGATFSKLFFGRIIGTPQDIQGEIVKLTLVAKPSDYNSKKEALANTLKSLPLYDPVWINADQRDNPDTILESRPELWHTDRVTHNVTVSNINSGEDGVVNLGTDYFYDSLEISYSQPPLTKINVDATVSWTESVTGIFDVSSYFKSPIKTLTGQGLIDDWPDYDTEIGGSWYIGQTTVSRIDGVSLPLQLHYLYETSTAGTIAYAYPVWALKIAQKMKYLANRKRSETINFSLQADVQDLFFDVGQEAIENISFSSEEIDKPIDEGSIPLVSGLTRTYFKTSRGKQSLEYLIAVARTKLLSRSRAVIISGQTQFENGLNLSCRKDISIEDSRIATGAAIGKITSYSLFCNGDSGELGCKFTIGCTIGKGNSTVVSNGSPSYVDGYVQQNYQYYSGAQFQAYVGNVTYNDFSNLPINDDGFNFSNFPVASAVHKISVVNPYDIQKTKLSNGNTQQVNSDIINNYKTQISIAMTPISEGPFPTTYNITMSSLKIPKTIDLEI